MINGSWAWIVEVQAQMKHKMRTVKIQQRKSLFLTYLTQILSFLKMRELMESKGM